MSGLSDKDDPSSGKNRSRISKSDISLPIPTGNERKHEINKQNVNEGEEELKYSNVAAKTVANIRRLQENVMSVSVTTTTSPPPLSSPQDFDVVGASLSGSSYTSDNVAEQLKHTNNVSTISVNNTDPSNHLVTRMNQSASSSMKVLQIEDGASNRNPSSSSLSSQNDNLAHQNVNLLSPKSPASIEQGQQHDSLLPLVQPSSSFSQASPTQSPIKPAHSFFNTTTNSQDMLFGNKSLASCQLAAPNIEVITSPGEPLTSHNHSNTPCQPIYQPDDSNRDNGTLYDGQLVQSSPDSSTSEMRLGSRNIPTCSVSPKNPINGASISINNNSGKRSALPVISNELTSSFNALVTIDPNWQSTKSTVRERNAVMCNNAIMADVWFNVGSETLLQQIQQQQQFEFRNKQESTERGNVSGEVSSSLNGTSQSASSPNTSKLNENPSKAALISCNSSNIVSSTTNLSSALPRKIPGHKYILATGSTVFYAMFYGGLAMDIENGNSPDNAIDVPDVEPTAFLAMLKYLYCDDIDLSPDNVLPTLYAAKKYIIPFLAQECVRFLESSLSARNACMLLSQARFFDEPALTQRAWEVIDAQAQLALTSDTFVDIDKDTLELILARETLNCRETVIFNAAKNWALAECVRKDIQDEANDDEEEENENGSQNNQELSEAERCRQVLGRALYLVRFPCMTVQEFADTVAKSGLLTLEETTDIFLYFTASTSQKPLTMQPFVTLPRDGLARQICARFGSSQYRTNQWRYRGRTDSIQFCVDRRIFIVGFGLYGSSNGSSEYRAHIELKSSPAFTPFGRGSRVLAENTVKFFSDGSSNSFQVFFKQPVQIEPDLYYTASAVLDGAELSYFGQEGRSEVSVGRVTFQFQYSSESTNGTGVQGGQIPEIIFYGPTPGPRSTPNDTPIQQRHRMPSDPANNRPDENKLAEGAPQVVNLSVNPPSANPARSSTSGGGGSGGTGTSSTPSNKQASKDSTKPKE